MRALTRSEQIPLEIKVFVKEGKLYVQATGQPEFATKTLSATRFAFAPAQLEIEFDSAGGFTLKQGGQNVQVQEGGVEMRARTLVRPVCWPAFWPCLRRRGRGLAAISRTIGSGRRRRRPPAVQWDTAKGTNVAWTAEIPGLSNSSPVVWGDRVYVTTAVSSDAKQTFRTGLYGDTDSVNDSSPHQWKVLALDKKTGKVLWEQTALSGNAQDQAASEIVAGLADARHRWQSGGRVFRLRRALRLFDRWQAPVEERPRPAERRMVLRPGFGVGRGQLSGDPQEYGHRAVRPAEGLLYRRLRS